MAAFFCSPKPRPNRLTAFLCPLHFSSLFLYPPSALFILTIIFIFALPAPACPARSLPHFTYTDFLHSPLRLHQPPKRFQINIPPSTACLCLPSPAGLHISAAPLFSYPVFLSLHCYQLRLKPFCHQMRFATFAPLGLPLILRKEKLFSLYSLIRQTPSGTCPRPRGFTFPPPRSDSPR